MFSFVKKHFISPLVWPPLHPLFYSTLSLIGGILAHFFLAPHLSAFTGSLLLVSFTLITMGFLLKKSHHRVLIFLCSALCVWGYLFSAYQWYTYGLFPPFVTSQAFIDCQGTIISLEKMEDYYHKERLTIQLTALRRHGSLHEWIPCSQRIQFFSSSLTHAQAADIIELTKVKLTVTQEPSLKNYYMRQGIHAGVFTAPLTIKKSSPSHSLIRWWSDLRRRIFERMELKVGKNTRSFLAALFFGNKELHKKEIEESSRLFQQWGLSHLFARSGLHLVLLLIVWHTVFNFLHIPFFISRVLIFLCSFTYFILTWPTLSFARAFSMVALAQLCSFMRYPSHTLHLLTCVTLVFLMTNPIILFFLDFQLSFGITWALIWFSNIRHIHRIQNNESLSL